MSTIRIRLKRTDVKRKFICINILCISICKYYHNMKIFLKYESTWTYRIRRKDAVGDNKVLHIKHVRILISNLFYPEAIGASHRPFIIFGTELFGDLTVLAGIRDLRRVQDMNRDDASPAAVDTVFYSDSHTAAENGKHFLENDGLVEFRGVGLPCFTGRSLKSTTVYNHFVRPRVRSK